jgi:hypothetical protein
MKIYINKPRDHWVSPYRICEKVCFWREIDYDEPWVRRTNKVLEPVCTLWMNLLDVIHPKVNYIKIDRWDSWSLEHTLSPIILPILKQLKDTKHGAPFVDDKDVPKRLRIGAKGTGDPDVHKLFEDNDNTFFERYDYVLDEMIWTFEQLCMDDHEAPFYDHTESQKEKDFNKSVRKIKVDHKGLKAHNARIDNGLRLFGRYYRAMWD